ncbi:hypothetical protein NDN08_007925 [Rhodosorus marinus]|uniref:Ion transport domain-containing protein n=1 Tax=Rhodosorus marinus TaxID=101924 RepID=A0AAV8UYZ4_9RHOD|nr:hypothetical protein NDN08_007925 [Rhodosorus marinus]
MSTHVDMELGSRFPDRPTRTMASVRLGETSSLLRSRRGSRMNFGGTEFDGRNRGVLGSVFTKPKPKRVHEGNVEQRSWLYDTLDPKSNSGSAKFYKYSMSALILLNMLVFVIATDDSINAKYSGLFYVVEGVTSVLFLIDYICRLIVITEHKHFSDPVWGRIRYLFTPIAVVDAISTFPFFIEIIFSTNLPLTTPLRLFRLTRILKTETVSDAISSAWRVMVFNKDILVVALILCLILTLITSTLLYYFQPQHKGHQEFESIPATIFLSVLMLTGQGGPDGDLPWYTKMIVMMTAIFSVAMFAIPASMLTWGFEAEAERLAKRSHEMKKKEAKISQGLLPPEEASSDSDDDFGRWFFRGEPTSDEEEWDEYANVILGSSDGSEDGGGEGDLSVKIPATVEEFRVLQKAKDLLMSLNLETPSYEGIEEVKSLAREIQSDNAAQAASTAPIAQIQAELAEARADISALRTSIEALTAQLQNQNPDPSRPLFNVDEGLEA